MFMVKYIIIYINSKGYRYINICECQKHYLVACICIKYNIIIVNTSNILKEIILHCKRFVKKYKHMTIITSYTCIIMNKELFFLG